MFYDLLSRVLSGEYGRKEGEDEVTGGGEKKGEEKKGEGMKEGEEMGKMKEGKEGQDKEERKKKEKEKGEDGIGEKLYRKEEKLKEGKENNANNEPNIKHQQNRNNYENINENNNVNNNDDNQEWKNVMEVSSPTCSMEASMFDNTTDSDHLKCYLLPPSSSSSSFPSNAHLCNKSNTIISPSISSFVSTSPCSASPSLSLSDFYSQITKTYYKKEPFVYHINFELSSEKRKKEGYVSFGMLGTAWGVKTDISDTDISSFFKSLTMKHKKK